MTEISTGPATAGPEILTGGAEMGRTGRLSSRFSLANTPAMVRLYERYAEKQGKKMSTWAREVLDREVADQLLREGLREATGRAQG